MHEIKQGPDMFFIGDSYEQAQAWIKYSIEGQILTIHHTVVNNGLQGQGFGRRLVEHLIQYCRDNEFKIIAKCPFAHAHFDKHPELRGLLEGRIR